jgi:hypothetical protein
MIGPNMANGKVAQTRTRDDMRRADRERLGAEARATSGRSRRSAWVSTTAMPRPEPAFTRWTRRRRRAVTTVG